MGAIVSQKELAGIVATLKQQGRKIVTTNGAFDILHVGHAKALQAAKALGDVLIVGLNSDSSVKQYKSDKRPVIGENDRAEMLAALSCVDYVAIFSEADPRSFLELVKPHIHTKSGDYNAEKMIETPTVRRSGGEVRIMPFVAGKSTTGIIERIREVYGQETH
jgi:rfaE bifunctional protein nucleotidyltransferase chain/domain